MDKQRALRELERQFRAWKNPPLKRFRINPVFGEGTAEATVMLVGEAPGSTENRLGRPFVGRAGRLLDRLLSSIGLERKDVYITSVLKDQPPGNRDPKPEEIAAYAPYLWKQIEIINPKVIVLLGRYALQTLLPEAGPIGVVHGQVYRRQGRYLLPVFHPAAALYRRDLLRTLFDDFGTLTKILTKVQTP